MFISFLSYSLVEIEKIQPLMTKIISTTVAVHGMTKTNLFNSRRAWVY